MSLIDLQSPDGHQFSTHENNPDGATASVIIIQGMRAVRTTPSPPRSRSAEPWSF